MGYKCIEHKSLEKPQLSRLCNRLSQCTLWFTSALNITHKKSLSCPHSAKDPVIMQAMVYKCKEHNSPAQSQHLKILPLGFACTLIDYMRECNLLAGPKYHLLSFAYMVDPLNGSNGFLNHQILYVFSMLKSSLYVLWLKDLL